MDWSGSDDWTRVRSSTRIEQVDGARGYSAQIDGAREYSAIGKKFVVDPGTWLSKMARNHEKAKSMLHQWAAVKAGELADTRRRPGDTRRCDKLEDAEVWRGQVIAEIRSSMSQINNPELDDTKARELNNKINKLLTTKYRWERRIIQLNGPDYIRASNARNRGDRNKPQFFGVAKNLPEAKAAEKGLVAPSRRKREKTLTELRTRLTDSYYGVNTEKGERGTLLLQAENTAEKEWQSRILLEKERAIGAIVLDAAEERTLCGESDEHTIIPSESRVHEALMNCKKRRLIAMYANKN